jgi:hypothetical protein
MVTKKKVESTLWTQQNTWDRLCVEKRNYGAEQKLEWTFQKTKDESFGKQRMLLALAFIAMR